LREQHGMSQVALAKALRLSPSYLNQIEHNQRPLTLAVQLKLEEVFGAGLELFDEHAQAVMMGELREVLVDLGHTSVSQAELKALAGNLPDVGRLLIDLHRSSRSHQERADALNAYLGEPGDQMMPMAGDQVRDYFNQRHNHIAELDDLAEALFDGQRLAVGQVAPWIRQRLLERHGVMTEEVASSGLDKRHFDPQQRTLRLPDYMRPGQQAFQMAAQLVLLEHAPLIEQLTDAAGFDDEERRRLARIGLSNYFAAALVMPYTRFLQAAEACRYDIERLAHYFGVGFEAVCHRLTTLHRQGALGLPFFFVRVDRAGNVSKRHSATSFHFSHVGGSCPLWIVYEAFNQPTRVLAQVARMPDGRRYFWIARQVSSGPIGYGQGHKTFAVSLGCDLRHADRLVYSRGLDLSPTADATPIGPGCRVCERNDCLQRAFPPLPGKTV
jgi:predicted transcriptional regulator/DNA-binding XRE family transcriptional regulator